MTINLRFQNWSLITDELGEQFVFEHQETGDRVALNSDGSVSSPSLLPVPGEDAAYSVSTATSTGHAIAVRNGVQRCKVVDPTDYATDDAALQALVNYLEATELGGELHYPTRVGSDSDGRNLLIENTVAMDESKNAPISFYQHGGGNYQGSGDRAVVETTITDGSPMFYVNGGVADGAASKEVSFVGSAFDLDGQNAGVVRFHEVIESYVTLGDVRNAAGDVITFEANIGACQVYNTHAIGRDATNARLVVFEDPDSEPAPGGDNIIGPNIKTDADWDVVIDDGFSNRLRVLDCSLEGGQGAATLRNREGSVHLSPTAKFGNNGNGAHGVLHEGTFLQSTGAYFTNISGDAIRNDGGNRIYSQNTNFDGISGDAINLVTIPGGVVPYESTYPEETFSYPSGGSWPYNNPSLTYPDGTQPDAAGTTTGIEPGSSADVTSFAGKDGFPVRVELDLQSTSGDGAEISWRLAQSSGNDQQDLVIVNHGSASADVEWTVYQRV